MEAIIPQALKGHTELGSLGGAPKIRSISKKEFLSLQGTYAPLSLLIKPLSSCLLGSGLLRRKCYAMLSHFSRVRLCATPEMAAHQAPPSLGFSRQEHWSGLSFSFPMRESEKRMWSHSVMSDSQRPHGLQPTRLLHPWDFPDKCTGVGCHCLLCPYNARS